MELPKLSDSEKDAPSVPQETNEPFSPILATVAKFAVVGLFSLYGMGFIIWHSFLATYGVYSIGFLQVEYLSSALCYLLFVACVAIPPVVLIERWNVPKEKGDKTLPVSYLIYVWYLVSLQLWGRLFPNAANSMVTSNYMLIGGLILIFYMGVMLFLKKRYKDTKWFERIWNLDVFSFYFVGMILIMLFFSQEMSRWFVVWTTMLYATAVHYTGRDIRDVWRTCGHKIRILLTALVLLLFVSHLQQFGASQFIKISRQIGGGKPEKGLVRFSTAELPPLLGLTNGVSGISSNGLCGPVAILLRTDKEMFFVRDEDFHYPEFSTNQVALLTTNFVFTVVSNISPNANPAGIPGLIPGNICVTTNIVPVIKTNVTKASTPNITARSVRAELIDVVLFVK